MKALREFIIRLFLKEKPKGVMTALPNKDLVDMNIAIVAEKLMRNGIDPNSLKNANQVENAIKMIDDRPKVQEGITATKSAKIMDMEGKEIDPRSKIMGGKQAETEAEILARINKENKEGIARIKNKNIVKDAIDNASPGFVSGDRKYNAQLVAEDLAERKFGKEFYDLDQRQQMDLYDEALEGLSEQTRGMPDPEDFAQGGRAGFANGTGAPSIKLFPRARGRQIEGEVGPGFKISERDIDYGITGLLQGDKFFGGAEIDKGKVKLDVVSPDGDTVFKDTISKDDAVNFILGAGDPRGDKFQIKTDKDFENMQVTLRKTFNKGGIARLGFKDGMTRRTFLKILGGAMAIPIVGKFLKPLKTAKGVTKVPMIKTDNVPGKPEWFDQLVNKVIVEGDDVTKRFATGERQSIHSRVGSGW
jgi:hypothetical protein